VKAICAAVLFFSLVSALLNWRNRAPTDFVVQDLHADGLTVAADTPQGHLHLLVPATSSNAELCKLLLSCQILGYSTPV
jgi:hypothetical protein